MICIVRVHDREVDCACEYTKSVITSILLDFEGIFPHKVTTTVGLLSTIQLL